MIYKYNTFLILFLLFIKSSSLFSQNYSSISNFNTQTGLCSDIVYTVTEDKENYIWISSPNGVSRFNGNSFVNFSTFDGLPTNDIFKIDIDSNNNKWLSGFYSGLYFIKDNIVHKVKNSDNFSNLAFSFERKGIIYFSNYYKTKSYMLQSGKLSEVKSNLILIDYNKSKNTFVAYDNFKRKYLLLSEDLSVIKEVSKGYTYLKNYDKDFYAFVSNNDDINPKYHIINSNLILINNNNFSEKKSSIKNLIIIDKCRNYINGYNTKIINGKIEISYNGKIRNKLSSKFDEIRKIYDAQEVFFDSKGNLWLIDINGNLYFYPYNFEFSRKIDFVTFTRDHINNVFYTNNRCFIQAKNKLYHYDVHTDKFDFIKKLENEAIIDVKWNYKTHLIVFKDKIEYYTENFKKIKTLNFNSSFRKILVINDTVFGISSRNFMKNNKVLFSNNNLRFNDFEQIDNNKFVLSNEEAITLYNLKANKVKKLSIKNTSRVIKIDSYCFLLICNNSLNIVSSDLKILSSYYIYNKVNCDFYDRKNSKLYLSFNGYIQSFKIEKHKIIPEKIINSTNIQKNEKINNLIYLGNKFLASHNNGIILYDLEYFNNLINGEIEIFSVENENRKVNFQKNNSLVFDRNKNNIKVKTFIKSADPVQNFKKFYKLKRNNSIEKWSEFSDNNLQFLKLQPGNYELLIKAIPINNLDNVDNKISKINFEIKPYFWETNLFSLFILLFLLLLITLFVFYKRKKIIMKHNQQLLLNTLELKSLKAQMNPHFLFNILNNLQSAYILKNEIEANKIFIKFSNLLRSTLDIVNNDRITLNNEINYIKSYLELESSRYENFNFTFFIDDELEINKIVIPVMVLQPIIENSLIHGLAASKRDIKQITINFKIINENLQVEIIDNGVGRNNNFEKVEKKNKSYGTKIIKERLSIMKILEKKNYSFELVDVYENSLNIGTKAVVLFPIVYK